MLKQVFISARHDLKVRHLRTEFYPQAGEKEFGKDFLIFSWGDRTLTVEMTSNWEEMISKLPIGRYLGSEEWQKVVTAIQHYTNKNLR